MQTYSNSNSKLIPQGIALLLSADTLSNLFLIPVVVPSPSNTITTSSRSSNTLQATEFKKALAFTLQWEGGYSNHINDLGGKTFKGITQAKAKEYGVLDPRHLSDTQIHQIYQLSYWDAQKCWQYLPPLIRNKLSSYASCQGDFRRGIKEKLVLASLSLGERCNN